MRQTVRLGRVAGIPVGMHWSVLVIMLLLAQGLAMVVLPETAPGQSGLTYWAVALVVTALFLVALLAHELSHSLVARHYGIRVRRITLWLLGGVAELDGDAPHARADLLVALAGPAMSLVAGVVFGGAAVAADIAGLSTLAVAALSWLAVVNVILAVFNLLPGAPLDGGRVLRAVVWWIRGDRVAAQRTASRAGVVLGLLLVSVGVLQVLLTGTLTGLWLVLLGWFLTSAARAENFDAEVRGALDGVAVGDAMSAPPVYGFTGDTIDDFIAGTARRHPHRAYPTVEPDGRLAGIVTVAGLTRVPRNQRVGVTLREVQVPLARVTVLVATAPLTDAATTLFAGGHRLAPVVDDGRLVGVLTAGDITRAIEMASLLLPDRAGATRRGLTGLRPPAEDPG